MIGFLVFLAFTNVVFCDDGYFNSPIYKYRYETQDVMNTAASSIPVHGYHVVEGGYYPYQLGQGGVAVGSAPLQGSIVGAGGGRGFAGPGLGGFNGQYVVKPLGLIGPSGYSGPRGYSGPSGYSGAELGGGIGFAGPKFANAPLLIGTGPIGFGGGLHHHHPVGGEAVEKKAFSEQEKKHEGAVFDKKEGKEGGALNHGQAGFSKDEVAAKDAKSDAGYYNKADGEKNLFKDQKEYQGGKHFNKQGKAEEENTQKTGHKKGHKVKSFKTTHHKDESGKTEEYYDESHDEGGNYAFKGASENSGEKGGSSFKGGKEEEKYKSGEAKEEGKYNSEHLIDKADSKEGKFGENKYAGADRVFESKNGADEQSLLSNLESSKFYKAHPFVVPFHH